MNTWAPSLRIRMRIIKLTNTDGQAFWANVDNISTVYQYKSKGIDRLEIVIGPKTMEVEMTLVELRTEIQNAQELYNGN